MLDDIESLREQLKANRNKLGGYRKFATDVGVGESWLYKFVQGRLDNPTASNLAKVRQGLATLAT